MAAAEWLAGLVAAVLVPDHAAHSAAGGQQHQGEPAEARASHQEHLGLAEVRNSRNNLFRNSE